MASQSAVIRDWLGEKPFVVAVRNPRDLEGRSVDLETVEYLVPKVAKRRLVDFRTLRQADTLLPGLSVLAVVHPTERESEDVRFVVTRPEVSRAFVMVWAPSDRFRTWLDGIGALDLHRGTRIAPSDPLMLKAARMMLSHAYNSLDSGRGKAAVVQLVRAFAPSRELGTPPKSTRGCEPSSKPAAGLMTHEPSNDSSEKSERVYGTASCSSTSTTSMTSSGTKWR